MQLSYRARLIAVVSIGVAASILATPGHPAGLLGPDGKFSALFSRLEWEPGYGCSKPSKPYEWDEYSRDSYIRQAKSYLECIKRQADNDAEYAAEAVYDGYKKAANDFIEEASSRY